MAIAHGGWSIWVFLHGYVYAMDLFFDFAGYSLFAVATSYVMGIETPMNFNKPWISHNVKDFWNRWHMTLSFWFRDYIYMRLVFFMMKKKWLKSRIAMANIGYLTLFLIMGFWHGETWYYIAYGLFQAIAMIVCDAWQRFKKKHRDMIPHNKFTEAFAIFLNTPPTSSTSNQIPDIQADKLVSNAPQIPPTCFELKTLPQISPKAM